MFSDVYIKHYSYMTSMLHNDCEVDAFVMSWHLTDTNQNFEINENIDIYAFW